MSRERILDKDLQSAPPEPDAIPTEDGLHVEAVAEKVIEEATELLNMVKGLRIAFPQEKHGRLEFPQVAWIEAVIFTAGRFHERSMEFIRARMGRQ